MEILVKLAQKMLLVMDLLNDAKKPKKELLWFGVVPHVCVHLAKVNKEKI